MIMSTRNSTTQHSDEFFPSGEALAHGLTKRQTRPVASCIVHADECNAIKLFNHNQTGQYFVNTQLMNVINQGGITLPLLLCGLGFTTKVTRNPYSTKNSNNTTKQPTELTLQKYGHTKNKQRSINPHVHAPIESFRHSLKPKAVPDAELNTILSRLFAHYLFLVVVILLLAVTLIYRSRHRLLKLMKFIAVRHFYLFVGGKSLRRSILCWKAA